MFGGGDKAAFTPEDVERFHVRQMEEIVAVSHRITLLFVCVFCCLFAGFFFEVDVRSHIFICIYALSSPSFAQGKHSITAKTGVTNYKHIVILDLDGFGSKHMGGTFKTPLKKQST
jgi:hypothetical protein